MLLDESHIELRAMLAAGNLERQFDLLRDLVEIAAKIPSMRVDADMVRWLHAHATVGLVDEPGVFRKHDVRIGKSLHQPPSYYDVQKHFGDYFVELHLRWDSYDMYTLAAFALWRLCWIHPFEDGNGRTARAVAYLIISLKLGGWLPGRRTILERIKLSSEDYKRALQRADVSYDSGTLDLVPLAKLLSIHTVEQLEG